MFHFKSCYVINEKQCGPTWHLTLTTSMACILTCSMDICQYNCTLKERWLLASVVNDAFVTDSAIQQSCITLWIHTRSLLNCFQTGQGPCVSNLHRWGLAKLWTTADSQPHHQHMFVDRIWRLITITQRCWWWRIQTAVNTAIMKWNECLLFSWYSNNC